MPDNLSVQNDRSLELNVEDIPPEELSASESKFLAQNPSATGGISKTGQLTGDDAKTAVTNNPGLTQPAVEAFNKVPNGVLATFDTNSPTKVLIRKNADLSGEINPLITINKNNTSIEQFKFDENKRLVNVETNKPATPDQIKTINSFLTTTKPTIGNPNLSTPNFGRSGTR